jgi:very-short-patch-repair endonuclease
LKEAIRELQPERYAKAYARVAELHNKQNIVRRRRDLLAKLKNAAPDWARSIELREGLHGRCDPPGDPEIAWLWKQFTQELDRRASTDIDALRKELADRSTDLQRLTAELVAHKAWAAQIKRTSLHQRQALQGWKKLMLKVPKGKGIRKPRLLDEARKLMPVCQTAIPVWIMPLSRVVETFDPRANRFDVIIIDEASQADVMSLAALYLGNEIMVVGDHEQVTPAAIGAKLDEVQKLIDEYLTEIPNANLYDGQTSVYDLAGTSYPGMVSLREHFRCAKQIIQFSTHLSYNGKILPLRDTGDVRTKPHCIAFRVSDGSYDGTINENEARWVAALLIACIEQEEYAESTFGVISLVGEEQALRIDQILHTVLPPMEYQRRHIQCGNAAQFQGDERDIVFLSLVDSPPERPPLTMRGEGYQGVYKKRFNVAASRARDQLWVVHSLDPQRDLKPGDLRLRLIRHAENPDSLDAEIERKEAQAESEFERQVIQALVREGFDVRPQWKVGAYRIDMVVISGDKKVAVECDGDKWHPPEKTVEDIGRQVLLERLGWKNFIRIRGSEYFRAPDKTIRKVVRRLQMLGIQASDHVEADGKTLSELYQRVERRAAELIRQWNDEGLGPVVVSFTKTNGRSQGINGNVKSENLQETGSNVAEVHCGEFDNLPTPRQQNRDQQVDPSDLPGLLRARGLEVIDKRHLGGNLWVVGGPEMEPIISEFKRQGIQFQFKERGGKATRHRPAWFTSYGSIPPTDQRAE